MADQRNQQLKNLFMGFTGLLTILGIGTYAFSIVEKKSIFDSFYYIFFTVTTVGAPLAPVTPAGKYVGIAVIFFGMGVVLYIFSLLAKILIEGQTLTLLSNIRGGVHRMRKERNHFIVCGYGKLGKYVCETFKEQNKKYIIIEKDDTKSQELLAHGESILQGDALNPNVLERAGVKKARGVIATLSSDADNIYAVMTVLETNPSLMVAAEATEETAVKRLHKVGAQIVVLPQVVGGKQLATAIIESGESEKLKTVSKKKK